MDENLARLNRIYPDSKYVLIPKYVPEQWEGKVYDSSLDNKAALNRWKTKPLTYEEAQQKAEEGYRIGWVVPEGYVIIDVDNEDSPDSCECLEKLLKKFEVNYSYNYTSRGIHFLLKDESKTIKTDSHTKCALNIVIDTRANNSGYIILPTNDPHREWGYWGDTVEDIPYFLKPMCKDTTPSFIGMVDGDGRNDALWKWRFKLEQCHKLSVQEIEKSIRIINENLFQIAIPNNELFKTVLREKDKKLDKSEKENVYNRYADELIGQYDIVSYYDNFYKFNGIYYETITQLDLEQIIHKSLNTNITKSGRAEIIEFIKVKTQVPISEFDKDWYKIAVKNGILNLVTGEVELPNKTDINTIFIPYEYNNDPVYSPRIDQFMKDLTNADPIKMQFLYQIAGYCLLKKNLFEKFFIFQGEGGTGKSTYMNLLHLLVGGDKNCSHVALSDMDKDYYLATTISKLLNIDDDVVDGKVLEGTGRFKSVISGNIISVRQIYREVTSFIPYCTCVFSCNRLPKIMDRTSGLYRRLILVELNNKVKTPDPLFMNKVTDEDMQYFLFKAVEGIKIAIEEGHFRINESEQVLLNKFKRRQSALSEWLYEMNVEVQDIVGQRPMTLYSQFKAWCEENGYSKIPATYSFKEDICALYDIEIDMGFEENGKPKKQSFVKRGNYDPHFRPF